MQSNLQLAPPLPSDQFTSGGVQNRETKNRTLGTIVTSFQDFKLPEKQISPIFSYFLINNALLYHFVANWLPHNKKMTEKSLFREGWSPEWHHNHSQCPVLVSRFCTPPEVKFDATRGRKIDIENFSLLYISVNWGDLIEKIKKSVIYTLSA